MTEQQLQTLRAAIDVHCTAKDDYDARHSHIRDYLHCPQRCLR